MNKEIKEKWVAALRSGKYQQSREILRNDNGFCCLGVLCDVVHPDGWIDGPPSRYEYGHPMQDHMGDNVLNEEALEEFGIAKEIQTKLYRMNDGFSGPFASEDSHVREHSFEEIADYIEKNL